MDSLPVQDETDTSVDVGMLDTLMGYHLRRTYGLFAADFGKALKGTEMRQVLFAVLAVVARDPGVNQGEVGRRLAIKRANMVSLVNELIERRLLERRAAEGDRRAFALFLTPQGQAMLEASYARILKHEARLLAPLSSVEKSTLLRLLRRIEGVED